jgi:hypothetical protein
MANEMKKPKLSTLTDVLTVGASLPMWPADKPKTTMMHGETVPVEDLIPNPARYFMMVRQIGIREKIGSLYLPDSAKDAQSYTHGLAIVLKLGPAAYKGRKFEDMGLDPEVHAPKIGDIVQFQARGVPARYRVCDIDLIALPDDSYYGTVEPHQVPFVSFAL